MGLRIVMADDEDGMRLLLRKAIAKANDCDLVGEAADGQSALSLVQSLQPDVVFLDVEMPVMDGITCAEQIVELYPKTRIVFVTAHETYMPDAFRLYAYDYLVKPFNPIRVKETLERMLAQVANPQPVSQSFTKSKRIETEEPAQRHKALGRLMLKGREGIRFLDESDICMIAREDRSSVIYTQTEKLTTSDSLNELMERLSPNLFMRCHKSYIINMSKISEITPYGRWTWNVRITGLKDEALMTHDQYEHLQELFQ